MESDFLSNGETPPTACVRIAWYAACDDYLVAGPYCTQAAAWRSLVLTEQMRFEIGRIHARGSYVWCEER